MHSIFSFLSESLSQIGPPVDPKQVNVSYPVYTWIIALVPVIFITVVLMRTKKIVHGPTDTADAKLYLDKQITPRKFMIRQIRGAAKKVGDKV